MTTINQVRMARRPYDRAASFWQSKMARLGYAAAYREALAILLPRYVPCQTVLDAGCGAGDFAAAYAAERGTVPALTLADPSAAMLTSAMGRLAPSARMLSAQARSIESLAAQPRHDVILCAHVIEHCADPVAALCHLGSILTPEGSVLLVVSKPHWCNWLIWLRWRHRSFARKEVLSMVAASGLCCTADIGFSRGPPRRTSHAYRITLTNGGATC